jgi:chromosome segregation ATPase
MKPASTLIRLAALGVAFAACAVHAQAPAPKPAAKPPVVRNVTFAPSAPAAPKEKLMSRAELKACFERRMKNDADAKTLAADQAAFRADYDAIKADQAAVESENNANRATRDAITKRRADHDAANQAFAAKMAAVEKPTEEQRAAWVKEREQLLESGRAIDTAVPEFNKAAQATRDRSAALDARVPAINERQKALNARVEPLQTTLATWRTECGDKAYDEADEMAVKKELGIK